MFTGQLTTVTTAAPSCLPLEQCSYSQSLQLKPPYPNAHLKDKTEQLNFKFQGCLVAY